MKVDIDQAKLQIRLLSPKDGDCIVITSRFPLNPELSARIAEQAMRVVNALGVRATVLVVPGGLDVELQASN